MYSDSTNLLTYFEQMSWYRLVYTSLLSSLSGHKSGIRFEIIVVMLVGCQHAF